MGGGLYPLRGPGPSNERLLLPCSYQEPPGLGGGRLRCRGPGAAGNRSCEPVEALDLRELPQPLPIPQLRLQVPSAEIWRELHRGQAEGEAPTLMSAHGGGGPVPLPFTRRMNLYSLPTSLPPVGFLRVNGALVLLPVSNPAQCALVE